MISSVEILLDNLQRYYSCSSYRSLSKKIPFSVNVVLNWSSGRTYPSIKQIDKIAFFIGIDASHLLIPNNCINIDTPPWKDRLNETIVYNLGKIKCEKALTESTYPDNAGITYRTFLYYLNGHISNLNLSKLDKLAIILDVKPYQLLERKETDYEKS